MSHRQTRFSPTQISMRGFSLLEIMIALALGLLLTAGIITLFANTSETNKLQDGLAHLQENGRFAVTRMENDMRMMAGQYCSNTSGKAAPVSVVPMLPVRSPQVYAPNIGAPAAAWHDSGGIKSINTLTGIPSTATAALPYALSPRWFVQGYSCTATGLCAPAVPTTGPNDIPAEGLLPMRRLPLSDVLTVRYQRGTGWPLRTNQCVHAGAPAKVDDPLAAGDTLTLSPQIGDSPVTMAPGLALVTDCANSNIIPIGAVGGNTLTVGGGILPGALSNICMGNPRRDVRVFDFSQDFVTVSYYVALRADPNPDARPNAGAARLIPTLIRRENGVDQELVQGVDQLKFLYGVQDSGGNTRFMTADQINAAATASCPPVMGENPLEQGCLWRAVRTVEAHMLINTVDEVFNLAPTNLQYTFMSATTQTTPTGALPSGLLAGSMMRREFVSYLSNRNYNF